MPGLSKRATERSPSASSQHEQQQRQSHDGACANCRTRKIRCDRERPTCGGCARDQAECLYSVPSKRINHVKVLCQGFDELQHRLISVQDELSVLTAAFKGDKRHESSDSRLCASAFLPSSSSTRSGQQSWRSSAATARANSMSPGYVSRDSKTLAERYHGPWTLDGQCRLLIEDLTSVAQQSQPTRVDALNPTHHHMGILAQTLSDSGFEGTRSPSDIDDCLWTRSSDFVSLPPRQFLEVTLETFFRQVDFTTDIFVRDTVDSAINQVYNEDANEYPKPWTVCLNLIVLHALGSNGPIRLDDPFMSPLFQATRFVARSPEFFLISRLVVLQALALLSLFAHEYHGESLGDAFFAQTCLLARTMGLHQAGQTTGSLSLSSDEVEERQKLFTSLYIRDRFNTTIRGSQSWLPPSGITESATHSRSSSVGNGTSTPGSSPRSKPQPSPVAYAAELALARIQGDLHQIAFPDSCMSLNLGDVEYRTAVSRIQQDLLSWSQRFNVPASTRPTTVEALSLHLAYLSTSIRLQPLLAVKQWENDAPPSGMPTSVLDNARLCCLLVVVCCTPATQIHSVLLANLNQLLYGTANDGEDHDMMGRMQPVSAGLPPTSPSMVFAPPPPEHNSFSRPHFPNSQELPVHRVASYLPSIAVFILSRKILGMESKYSGGFPGDLGHDEDVLLLQSLAGCLSSSPVLTASNIDSYASKLCRITRVIADAVGGIKVPSLFDAANGLSIDIDATRMTRSISYSTDSNAPSNLTSNSAATASSSTWCDSSFWPWDPPIASPGARVTIPDAWFESFDQSGFVDSSPLPTEKVPSLSWSNDRPLVNDIVLGEPVAQPAGFEDGRGRKRSRRDNMMESE